MLFLHSLITHVSSALAVNAVIDAIDDCAWLKSSKPSGLWRVTASRCSAWVLQHVRGLSSTWNIGAWGWPKWFMSKWFYHLVALWSPTSKSMSFRLISLREMNIFFLRWRFCLPQELWRPSEIMQGKATCWLAPREMGGHKPLTKLLFILPRKFTPLAHLVLPEGLWSSQLPSFMVDCPGAASTPSGKPL